MFTYDKWVIATHGWRLTYVHGTARCLDQREVIINCNKYNFRVFVQSFIALIRLLIAMIWMRWKSLISIKKAAAAAISIYCPNFFDQKVLHRSSSYTNALHLALRYSRVPVGLNSICTSLCNSIDQFVANEFTSSHLHENPLNGQLRNLPFLAL